MLNRKAILKRLRALGACSKALEWVESQPVTVRTRDLWAAAQHEWLLWLAGRLTRDRTDHKTIVLAACACAASVLHLVPAGEDRPRVAIETARAWVRDEATISHVRAAANAADAYAYAAAYARYAAYAAASAANTATNATYAADAANAATNATYAADAANAANAATNATYAADAASYTTYAAISDIVRKHITAEWLDDRMRGR